MSFLHKAKNAYAFLKKNTDVSTYIPEVIPLPKGYKPTVRANMLYFGINGGVFVLASVGLALEVTSLLHMPGIIPISAYAWTSIGLVHSIVTDLHFKPFHDALPVNHVIIYATNGVLTIAGLISLRAQLANLREVLTDERKIFGTLNKLKGGGSILWKIKAIFQRVLDLLFLKKKAAS